MMLKELFIHACIVISLLFLGGAFFRSFQPKSPIITKLILGILSGLFGTLLMHFSIRITDYILLDLRHVAMIISGLYGGSLSVIITTIMIATSRLLFFSIGFSAYSSAISMALIAILVILINYLKISLFKKGILMILGSTGLFSTMFYFILSHYRLKTAFVQDILMSYVPASLIGGLLTYYLANYIVTSNSSYTELKNQVQYDFLTGLKNVRQFYRHLDYAKLKAKQDNKTIALLFIDIDHFKYINDTYGHPAGDEVLRELGRILLQTVRPSMTAFRNGGEEFSIIMTNTNVAEAYEFAEKIRNKAEQHLFYLPNGPDRNITISIGIALNTGNNLLDEIIHEADKALYFAKNTGRNKVCVNK